MVRSGVERGQCTDDFVAVGDGDADAFDCSLEDGKKR